MKNHRRKLKGYPAMSDQAMRVLQYLRECERNGDVFVGLPDVDHRTINPLTNRDWIFESPGHDGIRYMITERGKDALRAYEAPSIRHDDGLCPHCRQRPVYYSASGRRTGYCRECNKVLGRLKYRKYRERAQKVICPKCGLHPRARFSNGRYSSYCKECVHARRADDRRKRKQRDLERVKQGEVLLCRKCKALPRNVYPNLVDDYCRACGNEYRYQARRHREFKKVMNRE